MSELMLTALYDALVDAGTDKQKARKAAEAVADYQSDIKEIKWKLNFLLILIIPMFLTVFGKFMASLLH